MSDTNGRTAAPPDEALFPTEIPIPRYPAETATIEAYDPDGYKVTWTLYDPIPGAVSQRLAAIKKQHYTPATTPPAGTRATEAGGGVPVCPNRNCSRHGEPMEPSQHGTGFYCKGKDTITGNPKGYCKAVTP